MTRTPSHEPGPLSAADADPDVALSAGEAAAESSGPRLRQFRVPTMAVGYTFVQAMFKAGRNPTRADLINAINKGLPQNVAVAPFAYSASDHNGIEGAYMGTIKNGVLVPTTGVFYDR